MYIFKALQISIMPADSEDDFGSQCTQYIRTPSWVGGVGYTLSFFLCYPESSVI